MTDIRPELEVEAPEIKTETQTAIENYSRLAHDAGTTWFQLKELEAQLEDINIKMRNARLDWLKAKKLETSQHNEEATKNQGVTQ